MYSVQFPGLWERAGGSIGPRYTQCGCLDCGRGQEANSWTRCTQLVSGLWERALGLGVLSVVAGIAGEGRRLTLGLGVLSEVAGTVGEGRRLTARLGVLSVVAGTVGEGRRLMGFQHGVHSQEFRSFLTVLFS